MRVFFKRAVFHEFYFSILEFDYDLEKFELVAFRRMKSSQIVTTSNNLRHG